GEDGRKGGFQTALANHEGCPQDTFALGNRERNVAPVVGAGIAVPRATNADRDVWPSVVLHDLDVVLQAKGREDLVVDDQVEIRRQPPIALPVAIEGHDPDRPGPGFDNPWRTAGVVDRDAAVAVVILVDLGDQLVTV